MIEFTKNELKILDLALKNKKYIISRQDDATRDNMLLYLCKKVIDEFNEQGRKAKILVTTDDFKYDKLKVFINNNIKDDEITIIKKSDFEKITKDDVYDCIIYDNLQGLVSNKGHEPRLTDIRSAYNKNKNGNKDFMFFSFYDGFLRNGALDIYAVMMIYYYNYLLINKLSEPKDFLGIMMEIKFNTYDREEVLGVNISMMLVNKIKSLVGFDDYKDTCPIDSLIEVSNEGATIYGDNVEILNDDRSIFRLSKFYDYIMNLIDNKDNNENSTNYMNLLEKKVLTKEECIRAFKRVINKDALSAPIYQFAKLLELDNNLTQCKIINKYNDILEYGKRLIG